jgi:hypothetical protein
VTGFDDLDFDRESCDLASANNSAATVTRQFATQLERAGHQARHMRDAEVDPAELAKRLDFALVHLASVMSEVEVMGLVNALRHAANATQDDHLCEFCGAPTPPWTMLTGDPDDEDEYGPLVQHSSDQYGVILCKSCHLAVRQARWQISCQM